MDDAQIENRYCVVRVPTKPWRVGQRVDGVEGYWAWAWLEPSIVQILAWVASTNVKLVWAKVGKVSSGSVFRWGLLGPKRSLKGNTIGGESCKSASTAVPRKGIQLISWKDKNDERWRKRTMRRRRKSPQEFSFLANSQCHRGVGPRASQGARGRTSGFEGCEMRSSREAAQREEEPRHLVSVGSAYDGSEKASGPNGRPKARPQRRAGRVFVCSVAVPISATGAKAEEALVEIENVGQGSRQNRLVTSGEELALWGEWPKLACTPGCRGSSRLGWLIRATERSAWLGSSRVSRRRARVRRATGNSATTNVHHRTVTVRGNPTV